MPIKGESVHKDGLTKTLVVHSVLILLGTYFVLGWNIAVLNQPSIFIKQFFEDTLSDRLKEAPSEFTVTVMWSSINAIFFLSGTVGVMVSGYIVDRLGRRKACMLCFGPTFIGSVLKAMCVSTRSPEILFIGRIVIGLGGGLASSIGPLYIAEIASPNVRGGLGTLAKLFMAFGLFLSNTFGIRQLLGTKYYWQYVFLVDLIPATISFLGLFFMPESPRYLEMVKHDVEAATKALRFLREKNDVSEDLDEMASEKDTSKEHFTVKKLCAETHLRRPLIVACGLQIVSEMTGMTGVLIYSVGIYTSAGIPQSEIQFAVMGTSATLIFGTCFATCLMDRAGRRPLLLYPLIVMITMLGVLTATLNLQDYYSWVGYISIVSVITFMLAFNVGLGPIPWLISAEMFRQGPRPKALAIVGVVYWLIMVVVVFCFELLQSLFHEFSLTVFLVSSIISLVFVYYKVPETKNRTFEDIARDFQDENDDKK